MSHYFRWGKNIPQSHSYPRLFARQRSNSQLRFKIFLVFWTKIIQYNADSVNWKTVTAKRKHILQGLSPSLVSCSFKTARRIILRHHPGNSSAGSQQISPYMNGKQKNIFKAFNDSGALGRSVCLEITG